jgi:hypothetical protein
MLNFTPALTKQHHSNLANIYVYQAQNRVAMQFDENIEKFGEIGGQIDLFYDFKKGTKLGGKYGTKLAVNFSTWFKCSCSIFLSFSFFSLSNKITFFSLQRFS